MRLQNACSWSVASSESMTASPKIPRRDGSGGAVGYESIDFPDASPPSTCRNSMLCIPPRPGTAIPSPIAASPTTKRFAIVDELSRRKPVLKKPLSAASPDGAACSAPVWQRTPMRVALEAQKETKPTFAIRGRIVDLVNDSEEEEDGTK